MRRFTAPWVLVLASLSAVIGAVGGFYGGFRYGTSFSSSMHTQANLYNAVIGIRRTSNALNAFSGNDVNSVKDTLELNLDAALIDFMHYAEALSYHDCEPKVTEALALARTYRAGHTGPMQSTSAKGVVERALAFCAVEQPAK